MLITPEQLERNRRHHERVGGEGVHKQAYGVSGWKWGDDVLDLAKEVGASTVLDYGAGKGTLEKHLSDLIDIRSYDPITFPDTPEPADIVVCTDVLEFLGECRGDVLTHIKELARKAVFIAVPKHPKEKAEPGLTIESLDWWEELLAEYWPSYRCTRTTFGTPRLIFVARCKE